MGNWIINNHLLSKAWGISLMEIMVAIGLTSGLLLVDMQRQENNQIANQRQTLLEDASQVPVMIRTWLRNSNAITYSFGEEATKGQNNLFNPSGKENMAQKRAFTTTPALSTRLTNEATARTDEYAIRYLGLPNEALNGGQLKLRPGTIGGVDTGLLIGPPNAANNGINTNGLGGSGRIYIRAMWIEGLSIYFTDSSLSPPESRGTANMKIVVWRLATRPTGTVSRTCGQGCDQSVYSIPLDLTVISADNKIIEGSFGLRCGATKDVGIGGTYCSKGQFFDILDEKTSGSPTDPTNPDLQSITGYMGRCCSFSYQ